MHRVTIFSSLAASALLAGCTAPSVLVEVLPPRTSATCAAPSKTDSTLGRGLLDVLATQGTHGAYVSDLRLSVKGLDARIDSLKIEYALPDGASADVKAEADAASKNDFVVGDTVLSGNDDDLRAAVVQNVQLVPRDLARALYESADAIGLDKVEYRTLVVTLTPVMSDGETAVGASSSFPIDLCSGCLVTPPDVCSEDGDYAQIPVTCRPGQDTPLFTCTNASTIGETP